MTELEKMVNGFNYDALDDELMSARTRAQDLCQALRMIKPSDFEGRQRVIRMLLPHAQDDTFITPPFFCDYGFNIHFGKHFYCNTGCTILDGAPVTIGDYVLFGPNVQIYTPVHALNPEDRTALIQSAAPIVIKSQVWIGGGAVICAGVTIGEGSVIGAGSVVTRDIPDRVLAAGNPCKVIRPLPEK